MRGLQRWNERVWMGLVGMGRTWSERFGAKRRVSSGALVALGCGLLLVQGCASQRVMRDSGGDDAVSTRGAAPAPRSGSSVGDKSVAEKASPRSRAPRSNHSDQGASPRPTSRSRRRAYRSRRSIRRRRSRRRVRPGLGTKYGESLYAPVERVSFERRSSRPSAVMQLHYNDPQGVRAMARAVGSSCCGTLSTIRRGGVSVRLTNRYGHALRGVRAGDRLWVMGRHKRRYRIRLRNHTSRRMEVVVSVDGLDVIDGRRASFQKRGYILLPHRTLWIDGFRRSTRHVAAFRFSSVRNSYAARTSGARNVGVIGVAVFQEERPAISPSEINKRWHASPFAAPPTY